MKDKNEKTDKPATTTVSAKKAKAEGKHYGKILEHVVRSNQYNISDLANLCFVNRRQVYNWFKMKYVKPETLFRVGCILNHDFSIEFPELFTKEDFNLRDKPANVLADVAFWEAPQAIMWKDKYIQLMEKYNALLVTKLQ